MLVLLVVLAGSLFAKGNLSLSTPDNVSVTTNTDTRNEDGVWYSYVDIEDAFATVGMAYPGEEYGYAVVFEIPEGKEFTPDKVQIGLRGCCIANLNWSFIKVNEDGTLVDEQVGDLAGSVSFDGAGQQGEFLYQIADISTDEVLQNALAVKVMVPADPENYSPIQQFITGVGDYNYIFHNGEMGPLSSVGYFDTSFCLRVRGEETGATGTVELLPGKVELYQNYPNPFNPTTTIDFYNNMSGNVKLSVYNAQGEVVANLVNGKMGAGLQSVDFDASNLNSGVYYYTLEAPAKTVTKKMVLVK